MLMTGYPEREIRGIIFKGVVKASFHLLNFLFFPLGSEAALIRFDF